MKKKEYVIAQKEYLERLGVKVRQLTPYCLRLDGRMDYWPTKGTYKFITSAATRSTGSISELLGVLCTGSQKYNSSLYKAWAMARKMGNTNNKTTNSNVDINIPNKVLAKKVSRMGRFLVGLGKSVSVFCITLYLLDYSRNATALSMHGDYRSLLYSTVGSILSVLYLYLNYKYQQKTK